MAKKRKIQVRCPICKNEVKQTASEFPFCSERCKTIDLGKWASGAYVISSPLRDISEEPEGLSDEVDEN